LYLPNTECFYDCKKLKIKFKKFIFIRNLVNDIINEFKIYVRVSGHDSNLLDEMINILNIKFLITYIIRFKINSLFIKI